MNPPDHFVRSPSLGTIYNFDHFFTHIHNLDLVFFNNFRQKDGVKVWGVIKTKSKGEKMIENVDGTKMIRRV